jgi:hypothetical protein
MIAEAAGTRIVEVQNRGIETNSSKAGDDRHTYGAHAGHWAMVNDNTNNIYFRGLEKRYGRRAYPTAIFLATLSMTRSRGHDHPLWRWKTE